MPDPEEIKWLQTNVNSLNNLLQVIADSAQHIAPACETRPDSLKYFDFLRSSLDRAIEVSKALAARLGGVGQPGAAKPKETAAAGPAKGADVGGVEVINPEGKLELILLIDDEPMITALVAEMLSNAGYRVITCLEPFRALEIFKKFKSEIDLVILDYTLPIMDGSEVFDELKTIRADVAVMLSSGFAEQEKVRAMLARGLQGFLPKPYTETRLLDQVRSTLAAIRQRRTGERRVI
jgi:CheY-like chemotaxis protein